LHPTRDLNSYDFSALAWARVDGTSPLNGRRIVVPFIGSPATCFQGRWYADFQLGQYEQVVANGALVNGPSFQIGGRRQASG